MKIEENFMWNLSAFLVFFGDKKVAFKSSLDLYFRPSIVEVRIGEELHSRAVADMSTVAGGRVFLGEIGRELVGIYCL